MRIERKYQQDWNLGISGIKLFLLSLGIFILWFVLLGFSPFVTEVTDAGQSVSSFKEEAKTAIKTLSVSLIEPLSKKDIDTIETTVYETFLEADKKGRPIRFGIGILDRTGVAVAGGYIVGAFKGEDFSKYNFVKKAFKKKKIIQNRLYFQDRSELLIICAPLVHQKKIIGAIVLGFDPTELKKDYGLSAEQFLALDFNK